ncbi:MAG: tetratricopeptide repeat protein [Clostridium sp.]
MNLDKLQDEFIGILDNMEAIVCSEDKEEMSKYEKEAQPYLDLINRLQKQSTKLLLNPNNYYELEYISNIYIENSMEVSTCPLNIKHYYNVLARFYIFNNEYDKARKFLNEALDYNPIDWNVYLDKVDIEFYEWNFEKALEILKEGCNHIHTAKQFGEAYIKCAEILENMKDYKLSLACHRIAYEYDKDLKNVFHSYVYAYTKTLIKENIISSGDEINDYVGDVSKLIKDNELIFANNEMVGFLNEDNAPSDRPVELVNKYNVMYKDIISVNKIIINLSVTLDYNHEYAKKISENMYCNFKEYMN